MTISKVLYFGLLLPIALLAGSPLRSAQPFSLAISAANSTIEKGTDDLRIKVVLTNTSDNEIEFFVRDECDYSFEVHDEAGRDVAETEHKRHLRCGEHKSMASRNIRVRLKPGESREDDFFVGNLKDVSSPGKYFVKAMRKIPKLSPDPVESNTLEITVANPAGK
jgi:hypothetical protein